VPRWDAEVVACGAVWIDATVERLFRHRALVLLALVPALAVAAAGALRLRFDFSPQNLFVSGDEDFRYLEESQRVFGRDDNRLYVHVRSSELFSATTVEALQELHRRLLAVPGVEAVDDLTTAIVLSPGRGAVPLIEVGGPRGAGLAGRETAIGDAIGLAVKRLRDDAAAERVLVLLTDGANTSGELQPLQAAEFAAREGLTIYTVGVGADEVSGMGGIE